MFGRDKEKLIGEVSEVLPPEAFFFEDHRAAYELCLRLQALDESIDVVSLNQGMKEYRPQTDWLAWLSPMMDYVAGDSTTVVRTHARRITNTWRARRLRALVEQAGSYLDAEKYLDGGRRMADSLSQKLLDVFSDDDGATHTDREGLIDELLDRTEGDTHTINFPWKNLNEVAGPLVPGEILGLTAFSGGGKSTLAGNIFAGMARSGTPCIYFSTEMGTQMLARVAAAESATSQLLAEKNIWGERHSAKARYREALERMKGWPFELVPKGDVSPQEIIRRTRILRRRWPGQTVVVFVDHVHRLDYGHEDPNKMVGKATRAFKNFAKEEGLVMVLLYQPRKPDGVELHKAVAAHQIRGDSTVWNEIDVHISPYRAMVQTIPHSTTKWGTPSTMTSGGIPLVAADPKRGEEFPANTKLSDEHVFLATDKRRIGGAGPKVFLHFHQPSGRTAETEVGLRPPSYQQLNHEAA